MAALQAEETGIRKLKYLDSCHEELPVGEVQLSNHEMNQLMGVADDIRHTRTALMGRLALREALKEARLERDDLKAIPFISATTVGGMDRREAYYAEEANCDLVHAEISTHHCGTSTEMIA